MNSARSRQQPPNGSALEPAPRQGMESRNGNSQRAMSRAERFEDEKRRITDSCFTKREPDGNFSESYITHIRITEDAASPSVPPPPESAAENKKSRVIIVAVRRSGRVRLHKARENSNGSFSIGKTWVLDQLTAIESFTGATPTTYEEQERKQWAGDTGVLVTIQKPYFWQTATPKEKDFFIGSLVKIYRKYTGGQEPLLSGFTAQELADFSALRPRSPNPQATPSPSNGSSRSVETLPASQYSNNNANRELRPPSSSAGSLQRPPTADQNAGERNTVFPGHFDDSLDGATLQEPKSRLQTLRNEPSESSLKPDSLRASPREDMFSRSPALASNREPSQTRQDAKSPSFTSSREALQNREDVKSPASFVSSRETPLSRQDARSPAASLANERLRANGTSSPFNRGETPPAPGPRSPDRTPSLTKPDSSASQPSLLPERRRPPLISTSSNQKGSALNTPAFTTPNEGPSPAESRQTPVNGAAIEATSQPGGTDYFNGKRNLEPQRKEPPAPLLPPAPVTTAEQMTESPKDVRDISSALSALSSPADTASQPGTPQVHRPGLGPMIKKKSTKEIAATFRKAAQAHNAFKPRMGGAGEKLKDELSSQPNTPDGINGVFVAPSLREAQKSPLPTPLINTQPASPPLEIPKEVKSTPFPTIERAPEPRVEEAQEVVTPVPEIKETKKEIAKVESEERRKKRPSNHSAKYAKALGIDPGLLEGRTTEIEMILLDFGWGEGEKVNKTFEDLHNDIKRDLAKVETGSWLGSVENNDDRVSAVGRLLDKAIAECDELDGLLTLYNVELGTLSEDIAYIEAQSQGLQVQTANQRLLHSELQNLLETITISSSELQVLKEASLGRPDGVQAVEASLTQLYKAMMTIDPKMRQRGRPVSAMGQLEPDASMDKIGNEVSTMRAVQEKKQGYYSESVTFVQRFKQYIIVKFREAEAQTADSYDKYKGSPQNNSKLDIHRRDQPRAGLWIYSPLLLFAREIDPNEWESLIRVYESTVKRSYQDELRENVSLWKKVARKLSGEEQDVLFTTQEKESDSLVGRKLTVKRSRTLREGPRTASGEKNQEGKIPGYEVFAGALEDMSQCIFLEQNFIIDMFHVTSSDATEFPDLIAAIPPEARRGGDLIHKRPFDPDRNMAKRMKTLMDDIFSFWPADIQALVDWVVSQDALHGVGVLFALEAKIGDLEDSNQEYIVQTLSQIHSRLAVRFDRFVEEQIRGIEDTKVKIKKRKGVIAFMKTFPFFASAVESMLSSPLAQHCEVRTMTNEVYVKINKAMFESLKFIAKESPVVMAGQKAQGQTGGDSEDKEILNYHILIIENMNHYLEEVDAKGNQVLQEWKENAVSEMAEHMDLYLSAVIRRPLGKLLDFIESTESLIASSPEGPTSIATRASHSRFTYKKLLSTFDAKEIRRGVETLKKRVDKHFGDADDPGLSRNLVAKVLRECEERYLSVHDRMNRIITDVYEGGLEIEFKKDDVTSAFKR